MKSVTGCLCVAIASLFLFAGCSGDNGKDAAPADVPALMETANVPGLAIATIDNCRLKRVSYYGVADIETRSPVTPDTLFEAASLTKTIFSIIVNQLADEGAIDLDRPLAETFEYSRVTDQVSYAVLTPRLILAHRSGFPNWASDPFDQETWGEIPFKNPPDTQFGYSGEAYQLLQAYVENATGRTLVELFEERLGDVMSASSLSAPKPGMAPSFGHDEAGGREKGRRMNPVPRAVAASSALTTARDYGKLLAFLCNGAGMSADARNGMLRPQSPTDSENVAWALGWGVQTGDDGPIYFHWGDNGPFKAFTAFNPETRDGVVYFANAKNGLKLIEPLAEPVVGDLDPTIEWLGYGRID